MCLGREQLTRGQHRVKPEQEFLKVSRAVLQWARANLLHAGNQLLLLQSEAIL